MSNIKLDTKDLKDKLEKTEQTGMVAWQVGSIAYRVKESQTFKTVGDKTYKTFNDYTIGELSKGEDTINVYINIYLNFPNVEDIENLLVSYLRELIRIKDKTIMQVTLKVFQELQNQSIGLEPDNVEKKFTSKEIKDVVDLIKDAKNLDKAAIENIVQNVKRLRAEQKKSKKKKNQDKHGKPLKDLVRCIELTNLLEYEPIDEQGFVGLFCLIFSMLREMKFKLFLNGEDKIVTLKRIKFIRQPFTDALFTAEDDKGVSYKISAEFEFKTSNYFFHKHHLNNKNCDLIITWIDDIKIGGYPSNQLRSLPPVFIVKDYLILLWHFGIV